MTAEYASMATATERRLKQRTGKTSGWANGPALGLLNLFGSIVLVSRLDLKSMAKMMDLKSMAKMMDCRVQFRRPTADDLIPCPSCRACGGQGNNSNDPFGLTSPVPV